MTEHVLVIGGGILGSSAAYRLACGVWVTLLDRADQGHATAAGAGAGIVSPATSFSAPPAQNALAYRAAAYYPGLVASLLIGADAVILATGGWDDGWAAQLPFRPRGGTGHHAVRGWRTGWARPG